MVQPLWPFMKTLTKIKYGLMDIVFEENFDQKIMQFNAKSVFKKFEQKSILFNPHCPFRKL